MDVRLFQTPDGGEITVEGGQIELSEGLDTAVYLSWFGGNEDDSGLDADNDKQWWANVIETDAVKRYRSELQRLLLTLPITPVNLRRFQDAAELDISWMTETGLASFAGVTATMPAVNTVKLSPRIEIKDRAFSPVSSFTYSRSTK